MNIKYKNILKNIILALSIVLMFSCSNNNNPDILPPIITFTAETGEYRVKIGKDIQVSAIVANAIKPLYSWKLNDKILSTEISFNFNSSVAGEYFLIFRVDAANGFAEEQIKVTVLPFVPPKITMPTAYACYAGKEFKINVRAFDADNALYSWILDGESAGAADSCIIFSTNSGYRTLELEVRTEEGIATQSFDILVLPQSELEPRMFFDNGRYRSPNNIATPIFSIPLGKSLVLSPTLVNISNTAVFLWKINDVEQNSTTGFMNFTPTDTGIYRIIVSAVENSEQTAAEALVKCVEPEGTYRRTEGAQARATTVYEYMPAPGQFVDFQTGSTIENARLEIQNKFDAGSTGWVASLGAFGGYLIVGFDHSLNNVAGKPDLKIAGNAFAGSSEPGTVWVMQDENGNGQPDDTWYELKGSETGKPETQQRYAITYYRPRSAFSSVPWTDNYGQSGSVDHNRYHTHEYYFPGFIAEKYTLCGTRLASTMIEGDLETSIAYSWGYVDNFGDGSRPSNLFYIEDAIQVDGSPASLQYIDFVKIQTAVLGKGFALGELSTEIGIPEMVANN
jgi:hypothetical protein